LKAEVADLMARAESAGQADIPDGIQGKGNQRHEE
jgi:hypothetical protein